MGADSFMTRAVGKTAKAAFAEAQAKARYDHGHAGYTGTIAEKDSFTLIATVGTEKEAYEMAEKLMDAGDKRIDDKWGPAGCIGFATEAFLFFGYASS